MKIRILLNGWSEDYKYIKSLIGKAKIDRMINEAKENCKLNWNNTVSTFGNITIVIE